RSPFGGSRRGGQDVGRAPVPPNGPPLMRRARRRPLPYRQALRSAVAAEAHAYGFTLVVWTTGALALTEEGLVLGRVLAFLAGALAAMAVVVAAAFSGVRAAYLDVEHVRLAYG